MLTIFSFIPVLVPLLVCWVICLVNQNRQNCSDDD